jgi:hypothetical protein
MIVEYADGHAEHLVQQNALEYIVYVLYIHSCPAPALHE